MQSRVSVTVEGIKLNKTSYRFCTTLVLRSNWRERGLQPGTNNPNHFFLKLL